MKKGTRNELLRQLTASEVSSLNGNFQQVELTVGQTLYDPFNKINYLYFPEDCLISLMSVTRDGLTVEVGVVGYEGLLGITAIFGGDTIPYRATVQAGGTACRVNLKTLRTMMENADRFKKHVFSYFLALHTQIVQSAICNKFHTVQERMAKWLLLSVDRSQRNDLSYTQEFLAAILGARRTTVSRTLSSLHSLGLIRKGRSSVTVLEKQELEKVSCECYEVIKTEFQKL